MSVNHGGKRKGSGRKPGRFVNTVKKEATVVMRVPVSLIQKVKALIAKNARASPE